MALPSPLQISSLELVCPISSFPAELMRNLSALPVVNNKSFAFVPPDFILGESPEVARNAKGTVAG